MKSANWASPSWRTALLALASTSLMTGCTTYSEPIIQDSTGNAAGLHEVAILAGEDVSGMRAAFQRQLQSAFLNRGVATSETANVVSDFAISSMNKDMALAATRTGDESGVEVLSAKRAGRLLDGCKEVRYRATLVLFNRETGERIHRAEGESRACNGDPAPLDLLADALVSDALLTP